jgi:hypothetical protein
MTDLLQHVELVKLAHDLGVDLGEVEFLDALSDTDLAELRGAVNHALFAPHEARFARLASMGRHVPTTLAAKGAQLALGPLIAARVAAVTDPDLAVKLVNHLSVGFLAKLTPHINPAKVADIVAKLPKDVVVATGELLVARQEYIPLGRFVAHVPLETALAVVRAAPPLDLLQVAIYTDDREELDRIIAEVEEEVLSAVLREAAAAGDIDDALTLLAVLSVDSRLRVVRVAAGLDDSVRDALVAAVARNDVWDALQPVLDHLEDDEVLHLLDVPALSDPDAFAGLERSAAGTPGTDHLVVELRARRGLS